MEEKNLKSVCVWMFIGIILFLILDIQIKNLVFETIIELLMIPLLISGLIFTQKMFKGDNKGWAIPLWIIELLIAIWFAYGFIYGFIGALH